MPKSGRNMKQSQYGIDETELIEFVKRNPPMYNPNTPPYDEYPVECLWEEISEKLNAPVDLVKKKWLNLKESYTRRKSLRSVHNLSFLPLSSLDLSNDNSCPSSNCSSPKEDGKRSMRSVSQFSTASEAEGTSSTLVSSVRRLKRINSRSRSRMSTSSQKDDGSVNEAQSMESNVRRFQEIPSINEEPRPALSESLFLTSKEEFRQNDASTPSRRLSDTPNGKNETKKHNTADSTRAFFESMAMTVSTFPQHIQATLKVRICNLVGDAEYGLTIPKSC